MPNSIFVRQQLEYVQNEVVKQDFPEMMLISGQIVPISPELPAGAQTYSYRLLTAVGSAKILSNGADDLPEVSNFMERRIGYVRTLANQYSFTWEDMIHAEYANMNLDTSLAITAREIMEREADLLGYDGSSEFNLLGLINHPNVPTYTVTNDGNSNGGSSSTRWIHKTNAQIYRDLTQFARETKVQTKYSESPDVIALPSTQYDLIATTVYGTDSDRTILQIFLEAQRISKGGVQDVIPVPYLEGKGAGGTDLMMSFRRRADKVKYHIAQDFTQHVTDKDGLRYTTPCTMRVGGVQCLKPFSMRQAPGI